jgi:hypothetical protein
MSDLSRKILESGLIDETTARMMEKWGVLDEGSADLAKKATLKDATREELIQFAEDIGEEVDKQRRLKETMLDLNHLLWPIQVGIWGGGDQRIYRVTGLVDRMGRYYFRPCDAPQEVLVPGFTVLSGYQDTKKETILEVTPLYVGDDVAAIQVSVQ